MKELSTQEMTSLRGGDNSSYPQPSNIALGSFNGGNFIWAPTVQEDPATAAGLENWGAVTAISNNAQLGAVIKIV